MRRRVLFIGRTRYRLPLDPSLARKWDALSERMEVRVLASGTGSDPRFRLAPERPLDGPLFYATLPVRVARELRTFRPDVVLAESPYEALAVELARSVTRSPAKLSVDVHGDWRTATRLYGSPLRRLLSPAADRLATRAIRKADGVRVISGYTAGLVRGLGIEPAGEFVTYGDVEPFVETPPAPLPEAPAALFVGVLEPYKNIDGLAAAWRLAAPRLPGAGLRLVGQGSRSDVAAALVRDLPEQASWTERLTTPEVAAALDASTCLVLPSRSEGLGRVVLEAFCRGRPVIGARVGGIVDLVEDGVNGLLIEPDDVEGLAVAVERVLADGALAARLGEAAFESSKTRRPAAEEYADNVLALVERVLGAPPE
jgi:glycosyltransferase involved in cell wall biosynthesis